VPWRRVADGAESIRSDLVLDVRAAARRVTPLRARHAVLHGVSAWRTFTPQKARSYLDDYPPFPPWPMDGPEPEFPGLVSQACTDNQMRNAPYHVWGERLRQRDVFVHRKQWEWFYIAQALTEAGAIVDGSRGLGFGVGGEPLTAWFAANGCTVLASDHPGGEHAADWSETGELARSLADLNSAAICPPDTFEQRVSFRPIDMRALPDDLHDFDFVWSSCVIEHLGSIDAAITFLRAHLSTMRAGGVSVHTTELNVSSNTDTLDQAPTVLLRRCDIERAAAELCDIATVAPCNWNLGHNPNDRYVAPDNTANTQLRLRFDEHVTTSFGLILRKR
jgi:hypothetical protein